jgi:hypothetical protein
VSNEKVINNDELEKKNGRKRSWPNFEALSQNSPEGSEESHEKPVRIVGLGAEI